MYYISYIRLNCIKIKIIWYQYQWYRMFIVGGINKCITPTPVFKYDWRSKVMSNKCPYNHIPSYCASKTWFSEDLRVYLYGNYTPDIYGRSNQWTKMIMAERSLTLNISLATSSNE